jgi:hypothetical protein
MQISSEQTKEFNFFFLNLQYKKRKQLQVKSSLYWAMLTAGQLVKQTIFVQFTAY